MLMFEELSVENELKMIIRIGGMLSNDLLVVLPVL